MKFSRFPYLVVIPTIDQKILEVQYKTSTGKWFTVQTFSRSKRLEALDACRILNLSYDDNKIYEKEINDFINPVLV